MKLAWKDGVSAGCTAGLFAVAGNMDGRIMCALICQSAATSSSGHEPDSRKQRYKESKYRTFTFDLALPVLLLQKD